MSGNNGKLAMRIDEVTRWVEKYGIVAFLSCTAAMSISLFLWQINHWAYLPTYIINNAITHRDQIQVFKGTILIFFAITTLLTLAYTIFHAYVKPHGSSFVAATKASLKSLSFLFLMPPTLHRVIWRISPLMMMLVVMALAVCVFYIVNIARIPRTGFSGEKYAAHNSFHAQDTPVLSPGMNVLDNMFFRWRRPRTYHRMRRVPWASPVYVLLALLILGYTCYFSYYTILNHYKLGTSTCDFTIFQNAFINTLHGNFMSVSISPFDGRSLLSQHHDFIFLVYLPFFYLFPKSETLLIIQSASIAFAALPLFLFGKKVLKSTPVAVSIAAFFLLHPANHGPNFYDIHQISFLPISVFLLFYFLERKSIFGFMISVLLILGIKDDMYILLLFVSLFIYLNGRENLRFVWYSFISAFIYGFAYNTVGRIWNIIPTFFYYEGIMVDKNGGLLELIKTVIANPLHAIRAVITKDKILYVAQLFGPVAFIPLLRKQNFLLFVYGLAATLLATRPFLYKISFQYVWYVVPFLFIGLVYVLKDVQTINQSLISPLKTLKGRIYPLLITVFFASFIYSWQYGAFPNNTYFIGGFRKVDFTFTAEDKRRLQALNNIVARIPPNASISASDCITPHLLNHVNVKKFASPDNSEPEYLFLRDPNFERQDYLEHLKDIHAYKVIYREGGFQLLKRSK